MENWGSQSHHITYKATLICAQIKGSTQNKREITDYLSKTHYTVPNTQIPVLHSRNSIDR